MSSRARILTLLALGLFAGTDPVRAQSNDSASTSGEAAEESPAEATPGSSWWTAWTTASQEDRLIWSMWTIHVYRVGDGWQNDRTVALIYDGFYGATFRTTHGPRAYSLGVERSWTSGSAGPFSGMVGYRAGLVYGYDHRLGWLAEKYPILPFVQPVVYGRLGPLTVDFTYTWVVMSLTAGLRF